jgi:hypothetical protein
MIKTEGAGSLYRGITAPIFVEAPVNIFVDF